MIIAIEAEGYFDQIQHPFIILKTLNQGMRKRIISQHNSH